MYREEINSANPFYMPGRPQPYFWKQMPFVRLIIPFISGILLQWNLDFPPRTLVIAGAFFVLLFVIFYMLPLSARYTYRFVVGLAINGAFAVTGALVIYQQDIRHNEKWIGNYNTDSVAVLATLQEPLVEKDKTYKALASADAINIHGQWKEVTGNVLIYFSKDSVSTLGYGSQVLFYKPLQEIKNAGNPGSFDYKRYNAFQDIFHQVFLKKQEYTIAQTAHKNVFKSWLFTVRGWVIQKLQQYIPGDREAGVAEALLIGYRDDLDKELVQAYSNTGVVHIIAISGLHLGMIYLALVLMLSPFRKTRWIKWVKPVIILAVLWIFTMLAGGVPSILRAAVMFTFIVLGQTIDRKSSIYNTLAASAFVMLCINPYYLWDVGFQLSYAAVVSIIMFSNTVYNWFFLKNKSIDFFWKLTSVTISAQVLTAPIIFYAFHQFPNYFLLSNCVIVPLSSVILFAELVLLIASLLPPVATFFGAVTGGLLWCMNSYIEWINNLPYAVYDGIQNSIAETVLLYIFIGCTAYWLLFRVKKWLLTGLAAMLIFIAIDAFENFKLLQQEEIIVYNIPKNTAIDFIAGKKYAFEGDTALMEDSYLINANLKPARTLHRVNMTGNLPGLYISYPFAQFNGKRILLVDKPFKFSSDAKIPLDMIIVSHNPKVRIADLSAAFDCSQYIFDASNSTWKIGQWKKDCDSLHLRHYSTPDEGAFEMHF